MSDHGMEVAIIGMNGRFPGAWGISEYWRNIRDGVESITFLTDEELLAAGVKPQRIADPHYVKAAAMLEGVDVFDADFFQVNSKIAHIMDPQHRLFLECAWGSLEDAGYDPSRWDGRIGVFAGSGINAYFLNHILAREDVVDSVGEFATLVHNDKDALTTQISFRLHLTGPSINVQTACSTSLVAVHQACQSLLNGECDMALAGGVSIRLPQKAGYRYQEGGILSPDGHCRAFDAKAQGTIFGSGVGIVVLRRLEDACRDRDSIRAVIKGSAINNDGSDKVGYTAPSVVGQAAVIREALTVADVDPETVTYIEAHGTGTQLGDPVEVKALQEAFGSIRHKQFCGVGSVKTNIGHMDTASGIAGLIKTVLSLQHRLLPPSLHFERPNPAIDFESSPFYVNASLSEWKEYAFPRRAGVSSFGIGGTNAHVILEEASLPESLASRRSWFLLPLSAKTASALKAASHQLKETFQQSGEAPVEDVAYTLQVGRQSFEHRRALTCQTLEDAIRILDRDDAQSQSDRSPTPYVVFLFPGQGSQHVNMASTLYRQEPVFRAELDRCASILTAAGKPDIRKLLYPAEGEESEAADRLNQTAVTQPVLFSVSYALARLWMTWGVKPQAMIGHSIGEYVAACIAGVFSLEEALTVVRTRGEQMQALPEGKMLAVTLPEERVKTVLDGAEELSLAAVNSPQQSVVAGPEPSIRALQEQLSAEGIHTRLLQTSHAFHSAMTDPMLPSFQQRMAQVSLHPPTIPYLSNRTGTWITTEEATDPAYWVRHLREPVRFADGIAELMRQPGVLFIEVGPGQTLSALVNGQVEDSEVPVIPSLPHPKQPHLQEKSVVRALEQLWLHGVAVDWQAYQAHEERRRLSLPTYPFQRRRYWVEPAPPVRHSSEVAATDVSMGTVRRIIQEQTRVLQQQAKLLQRYHSRK
jgi:phthiocerol/phenolphthiocerol synthesis type-I polyketide synthase E